MTWTSPDPGRDPGPPPLPVPPSSPASSSSPPPPWLPPPIASAPPGLYPPPVTYPPVPDGPREAWGPRPYPQVLRGPRHRWWRPLAGFGVAVGLVAALLFVAGVLSAVVMIAAGGGGDVAWTEEEFESWSISPAGFLVTNLSLAAFIPLAQLAVWVGHGWRPAWVASVRPGLRWRWMLTAAGVTLLVFAPLLAVFTALSGETGSPERNAAVLLLIVLLTTPLQAAGEEYLFRGWLSQAIGSLFPRADVGAVVAALVSATVFAFAHGQQDPWLFADRFAFGLVASWLVWRTGGLEAAIAVHAVNNVVAFVVTILSGQLLDALTVTEADPLTLVIDVVSLVAVALILDRLARRRGLQRLFDPQKDLVAGVGRR